jgi:hypothetical protein
MKQLMTDRTAANLLHRSRRSDLVLVGLQHRVGPTQDRTAGGRPGEDASQAVEHLCECVCVCVCVCVVLGCVASKVEENVYSRKCDAQRGSTAEGTPVRLSRAPVGGWVAVVPLRISQDADSTRRLRDHFVNFNTLEAIVSEKR